MSNIWRRSLSMFLALVMVFGMLPMNAFATETEEPVTEETVVTEPVETTQPTEAAESAEEPEETTVVTEDPSEPAEVTSAEEETEAAEAAEAAEATESTEATVPAETVAEVVEELPKQEVAAVNDTAPEFTEADFVAAMEDCLTNGGEEYILMQDVTITGDVEIPEAIRVRIAEGGSITVAENAVLTVKGILWIADGSVTVNGTLVNNASPNGKAFIVDYGTENAVLTIGKTGEFVNGGYFRMDDGDLFIETDEVDPEQRGKFTQESGPIFISSDVNLGADVEEIIGKDKIVYNVFADTDDELINGAVALEGYSGQSLIVVGAVTMYGEVEIASSIITQVGYTNTRIGADHPGSLTLASGALLAVNNNMQVHGNGVLNVAKGATLQNNSVIENLGTINASYNIIGLEENITGNPVVNERDAQSDFEDALANAAGGDFELQEATTLLRDLTIDLQGGKFIIPAGMELIVPETVTLTVDSTVVLEGGLIVNGTLVNNANPMNEAIIADVGSDQAYVRIGANGTFVNNGYFRMSSGELNVDGTFVYNSGVVYTSSDLVLSSEHEAKIGKGNIIFDTFAETEEELIGGAVIRDGYRGQNIIITGDVELTSDLALPDNTQFYLQVGYTNTRSGADVPGSLTLVFGAQLTVYNKLFVMNNGSVEVAKGATLVNNGTIDNQGTIMAANNIIGEGEVIGNPVENEKDAQGKLEDALANASYSDFTLTETVVLTRDMTIDLKGGTFCMEDDALLVVSNGATLTLNSGLDINSGRLVIQDGATLDYENVWIYVSENAELVFETGAHVYGTNWYGEWRNVYWDTDTMMVRYNVMNGGSGLQPRWDSFIDHNSSMTLEPGLNITGLFCIREWNSTTYEWENIVINPYDLVTGENLTVTSLRDRFPQAEIMESDPYRDLYANMETGAAMDVDTSVSYTYNGQTYTMDVRVERPRNHGFYSEPYASNETWISNSNGFEVDPNAEENSFYYIFTHPDQNYKIETFELVYSPYDPTPVTEATWEATSDPRVYKITVDPEKIDMSQGSFPVHVNVYLSHTEYGEDAGRWGVGQLWCFVAPTNASHLSMCWLNNDGNGWYHPGYEPSNIWLRAMDWMPVIFYWNVWDEANEKWISTPVVPESDSENITITRIKDLGENNEIDHRIADKRGPIDKYVIVRASGSLEGGREQLKVTINGQEYTQTVNVQPVEFGWYTADEISMDTLITTSGTDVQLNPFAVEENVYYLKMSHPEKYQIWRTEFGAGYWDEEAGHMVDAPIEDFGTLEDQGNGTWKFTVHPEFVESTLSRWQNFNLWAEFDYGNNSGYRSGWHGELWVNPAEMHQPDAQFQVNDVWCGYYEKFDAFVGWYPTGEYDEEGHEIQERRKVELPKGVSYDYETNTIKLNNATLSDLYFGYYWTDENGNRLTGERAGSDLPTDHLTLQLEGTNTISGDGWECLGIDRGLTVEITGSGSLYVKGEKAGEAGGAIWIGRDSHLKLSGDANVTVEIAGEGFWEDGTKARLAAIAGDHESTKLTVTGNATLTTVVPEGSRRAEVAENGQETNGYEGIQDIRDILVEENGTLNTQHLYFWDGGSVTQTGGTINLNDHGYTYYRMIQEEDQEIFQKAYYYCGIEMNNGTVDISGGTMNINVKPADAEIPYGAVQGIKVFGSRMNISGGAVNVISDTNGVGLVIGGQYDPKTDRETKGSTLNFTGGTLNVSGDDNWQWHSIAVSEKSKANFLGGEIVADGTMSDFTGTVVWGSENGTGTSFSGTGTSFSTYGPGTFHMYGGSISLYNGTFENKGNVIIHGGDINITNGMLCNEMSFGIEGGVVNIDNDDWYGGPGVENYLYLSMTDGELNVNANNEGTAFVNPGTFHQMGGNVTVTNGSNADNVMDSWGQILLNSGNLTLRGGTFGLIQGNDPDREADKDKTNDSMLQVQAGTLNINGCKVGILANGYVEFRKGSNVDISVSGVPDNEDDSFARWPAGIFVINKKLYIENGSNVKLTSWDSADVEAMSKGIVAWHNPVDIRSNVDIDAEMAIYSISATAANTNLNAGLHFWSDAAGGYLPVTTTKMGDSYLHTLMVGDDYAGQLKLSYDTAWTNGVVRECEDATSEATLISAVTSGAKEVYISKSITLTKALTIPADVTVIIEESVAREANTLNVKTGTTFVNNGTIIVCQGSALNINSTKNVENYGRIEVYGAMNLSTSKFYVNYGDTIVYPIGYLNMTKGGIMGNRICMIPGMDETDIGSVTLPQMYSDYYYIKGVALQSFQAWAVGYDAAEKITVPVGSEVQMGIRNMDPIHAEHGIHYIVWASNSPEKDPLKVITSAEPGIVTVYVQALDENGEELPVIDTFEVEFVPQDVIVTNNATKEEIETDSLEILSGDKIALKAEIVPNMTDASVVWELADGADYATLSVRSGVATVTAKALTEKQEVVLVIRANDNTARREIKLQITPKVQTLQLLDPTKAEDEQNVTGKTVIFDRNRVVDDAVQTTMLLQTNVAPLDASKDVTWKTTGFTEEELEDGSKVWRHTKGILEIRPTEVAGLYEVTILKTGKVTLTATTTDTSKKTAKITINAVELLQEIEAQKTEDNLIGGQSVTYYAMDAETPKIKDTLVEWFLCDAAGNKLAAAHPYASITAKGKLTTKTVAEPETLYIRARVINNETAMTDVVTINLYPAVTQVKVFVDSNTWFDNPGFYDFNTTETMQLVVEGYPYTGAIKSVSWSRPAKSAVIADIDSQTGFITPNVEHNRGAVTFTGVVTLHNGKTMTVKQTVQFGNAVSDMKFYTYGMDGPEPYEGIPSNFPIHGDGNSYSTIPQIDTLDANGNIVDADLTWSIVDPANERYVTVKDGIFKPKSVKHPVLNIEVAVTSDDGYSETILVTVLPKRDSQRREQLSLYDSNRKAYVTKETLTGLVGDTFSLRAESYSNFYTEMCMMPVEIESWTSSNRSIADVDENGVVTIVGESSTKTATITAKAVDGRTATVTVKGTRVSTGVTVTSKTNSNIVASGKTLGLVGTVTYSDNKTNTSVNWSVSDSTVAKISSSGVLTATANLMQPATVYVIAAAKDGHSESKPYPVTILPLATGVTILDDAEKDLNNTTMTLFVDEFMDLGAKVSPNAANQGVTWTSSNTKIAKIDKESGELTCIKAGTVTITATAKDGSGKKATFKVTVVQPMEDATLAPLADKNWGVGGGKSLKLASAIKIPSNVTNKKLTWEITGGEGAAYASLSSAGVLTTKAVSEVKELTVQVTAADAVSAVSGRQTATSGEFTVTIYPVTTALNIVEDGVVVNNKTLYVYLDKTLDLRAKAKPADAWQDLDAIKWTSSRSSDASVDPQTGVVTGIKAGKTVTITAAAQDGSGKKATVKVKVLQPVESIEFPEDLAVGGGKNLKLASKVIFNNGETVPTDKTLSWEILEGGEYATINAKTGELKTKKVQSEKEICVKASTAYGDAEPCVFWVTIYPATTKLYIHRADTGANVTGKTLTLDAGDTVNFEVLTAPITALQQWTWKSSNTKYVTVDESTGEVTLLQSSGRSTVTVTATATDGTGVKATFKVKVVQPVKSINFPELGIAEGKTLKLANYVIFNENENAANRVPTNKTLTWEIVGDDTFATVNTKGELKAKSVDKPETVTVLATATDGTGEFKEFDVTIYPATTKMVIEYNNESTVGQTITLNLDDEVAYFDVVTDPSDAMQQWKWTSSNKTYLTVDAATGKVTLKKSSGRNTVTITATATDGTNVKATVKVKVQ